MPKDHFPEAPNLGDDFKNGMRVVHGHDEEQAEQAMRDELDALDRSTRDYTPGGTIEQQVHTELSDNARRAYREQQAAEASAEYENARQIDQQFDQVRGQDEAERLHQEATDERELAEAYQEMAGQADHPDHPDNNPPEHSPAEVAEAWQGAPTQEQTDYDMPKDSAPQQTDPRDDPAVQQEMSEHYNQTAEADWDQWTSHGPEYYDEFDSGFDGGGFERGGGGGEHEH